MLVDPGACWQHLRRVADHDIIAADWCALSDIDQSYLVALGHVFVKRGTRRQLRTRGEPEVVGDNGHVVVRVHPDDTRRFRVSNELGVHNHSAGVARSDRYFTAVELCTAK